MKQQVPSPEYEFPPFLNFPNSMPQSSCLNPTGFGADASNFAPGSSVSSADYLAFAHDANGCGKKRRRQATVAQRRAANIRERKRMLSLNEAFDELRACVPTFAHEKKISRIDTLRLAIIYISFMADILEGKDEAEVEMKSLKHGWTSVREKLQQQMQAQHAAVFGAHLASAVDYTTPFGGPAVAPPAGHCPMPVMPQPAFAGYPCHVPQDFYPLHHTQPLY